MRSINVSGHKFGLVYPGIGWLVFREKADLAEDLVFYENYLGKTDATFTLNFSENAKALAAKLEAMGHWELIGAEKEQLPLVAFKLREGREYDEFDVSWQLSAERGWMLPPTRCRPTPTRTSVMTGAG